MMRVLQILNRPNIGGIVPQVLALTNLLGDEFETKLIAGRLDEGEVFFEEAFNKYNQKLEIVEQLKRKIDIVEDYKAYKKIRAIIRDYKPHIVHTHAAKSGAIGRLAAFHEKTPIIIHTFHGHVFHSYFGKIKTQIFIEIERFLAKKSSAIIAISELQKKDLVDKYKISSNDKVKVVNLGYDLEKFYENIEQKRKSFRTKWKLKQTAIVLGIVGRVEPIKNHQMFVDVIAGLKKLTDKEIIGLIIGDGSKREEMEVYAKNLGLKISNKSGKNCDLLFTSWITEVTEVYAGLDLLCLTSNNEGTPVSLIEAQATGIPIVATNVGGVQDTIINGYPALLSPKMDSGKMVGNILTIIEKNSSQKDVNDVLRLKLLDKYGYNKLIYNTKYIYKEKYEKVV